MPELPEVYTITKQLNEILPGKVIVEVEVWREKSFKGNPGKLIGKRIISIDRKQKVMAVEFAKSEVVMLIHLKMTGQLIYVPTQKTNRIVGGHPTVDWVGDLPSKHTRVVVKLSDSSTLFFNDQRVFGWLKPIDKKDWEAIKKRMPPDVIDEEFSVDYLYSVLQRSRRPVKVVIMDSGLIGGAGNIYANEALFLAKISPNRPATEVSKKEAEKLQPALVKVIKRGIETGGASMSHYVDVEGLGGSYQKEFIVYGREGEMCPNNCGEVIKKIRLGGRGSYFCPKCQR